MVKPYQDRYCAFVDILGFRQLVAELEDNTQQLIACTASWLPCTIPFQWVEN